ncbi:MAG TPA: histidine kinase [Bacteroidales bacterium]|nr:histidine kinase [Bacteroidales bacterium]
MKKAIIIFSSLIMLIPVYSQESSAKSDSLQRVLSLIASGNINDQYRLYAKLYDSLIIDDLQGALLVAMQQKRTAMENHNNKENGKAADWIGYIYYIQGLNDSSLIFFNKALEVYNSSGDTLGSVEVMNNIANIFRTTAKYDTAMVIYTNLLKYYEKKADLRMQGKLLGNIGSLYYTAGNQEKAKEYTLKSLDMASKTGDNRSSAVALVNLTVYALNSNNFEEGIKYGEEAIQILKSIDKNYYAAALTRVAYCYYCSGNKDKALNFTDKAIDIYKENNNVRGLMETYRSQADYLMDMGRYKEARNYGMQALQIADTTNRLDLRLLYDLLKRAAILLNIPDEAMHYSQEQLRLKEADLNDQWAVRIAEVDARYNAEKKELEIGKLKAERKAHAILNYSLLIVILAGCVAAYFIRKNYRQRHILAQEIIKQLEQEKQITATQALLEGENTERARLSRDLHDGLGGMLSVVKLKIASMKGNLTIPEEHVSSFNAAIELLDGSIRELRRVAHNLMPESLLKFGLNTALADFCRSTGKVSYHYYGSDDRINEKMEITVYRIANELVNNSLRYSESDLINVQLIIDEKRVSLVVEDNGVGFDVSEAEKNGGHGLKNVRSRVASMDGTLEIISSPGKGTEVNVEFKN